MLFNWIKNTAGKDRYVLTITGSIIVLIIAWILGSIFMPKNNSEGIQKKYIGYWHCKTDSETYRLQIRESGYFYYDIIIPNEPTKYYKGVITSTVKDTLTLIGFQLDTLLHHTIIEINNHQLKLKNIQNSSIITFTK